MRFRPCIDIHNGKVKQIVGGSLKDQGNQASENFVSEQDASYYAQLYEEQGITESVRLRNLFIVGTSRIIHRIWQKVGMMPIYTHRIINKQAQSGFPASDSQLFYKVTLGRIIHTIVIHQILQESLSFQKIIRQLSNLIILFRKRLSV